MKIEKYLCDACGKELKPSQRNKIKRLDICEDCFNDIIEAIKKYYKEKRDHTCETCEFQSLRLNEHPCMVCSIYPHREDHWQKKEGNNGTE